MTHYLEFLAEAHRILQPRGYLEIGVRHGGSLRLASCPAIGIDPAPSLTRELDHTTLFPMTSDGYFSSVSGWVPTYEGHPFDLDLAFIDGMHLIENALQDFTNIERYSNERTVVIFDDVLPYNSEIASRTPLPGDWTGDVWRVWPILDTFRPDLDMMLVDTTPTGMLLVTGLDPQNSSLDTWFRDFEKGHLTGLLSQDQVPRYILKRLDALPPSDAYDWLRAGVNR